MGALKKISVSIIAFMLVLSIFTTEYTWAESEEATETAQQEETQDVQETEVDANADTTAETDSADEDEAGLTTEEVTGLITVDGEAFETLQEAIDATEGSAVLVLHGDVEINSTVKISSDKSIEIKDDGNKRTISRADGANNITLFQVAKDGELTFNGTSDDNLIIEAGTFTSSYSASVVMVNGTLNIKHVTIEGGNLYNVQFSGLINSKSGSTVNMSGGIIENTEITKNGWYCSPMYISDGSVFNMSGGVIRNNSNTYSSNVSGGGGVLLMQWNKSTKYTTMNMTGGTISGNSAYYGGGVYMTGYTEMSMTGGEIVENKATRNGGGVCVSGLSATWDYNSKFVLDGGTVSRNEARNGGGIYVNTDEVYLKSGYIEGNVATPVRSTLASGHGGGVYVSEVPRVLHVEEALVTNNKAVASNGTSGMGGGLWACPTGSITLMVSDGVAVYDNQADGENTAGDDVVKVNYSSSYHGTLTLTDRTLGGGVVEWYQDGGVKSGVVGSVDKTVSRYDEENTGEALSVKDSTESVALKAVLSDSAKARANAEAKLYIRDNTAAHGGGIGTNGDLSMVNTDYSEWNLQVEKVWDGVSTENQQEIRVFLKIGEQLLDYVVLNEENNWKGSFENLPDPSSLNGEITVVEKIAVTDEDGNESLKDVKQYSVNYDKELDSQSNTIYVTITNAPGPTVEIPVTKTWVGKAASSATFILKANGEEVNRMTLTDSDNWTGKFTELPAYDNNQEKINYTIEEVPIEGYTTEITGDEESGFNVVNTSLEEPTEPDDDSPSDDTVSKSNDKTPKTGDGVYIKLALILMLIALISLIAVIIHRRKITHK